MSVWTCLTKGHFMDLNFTLWGMGIQNATMRSMQQTTQKNATGVQLLGWGVYLNHWVGVANTQNESQKHNPALEVEKNNSTKSKIS